MSGQARFGWCFFTQTITSPSHEGETAGTVVYDRNLARAILIRHTFWRWSQSRSAPIATVCFAVRQCLIMRPRSTLILNPTVRSVATGNQWSGPLKSRIIFWVPQATDRIVGLSLIVDQSLHFHADWLLTERPIDCINETQNIPNTNSTKHNWKEQPRKV